MFGYVRIYKPELKMAEFEHDQGVYCSLCKQLGKRYGVMARMTLSYDFTFLAVFRMALSDTCTGFKKGRCTFNPLKKRTCCCENTHVEFAADAATLLMYHKLKDNMADNGFFHSLPARLLLPFASRAKKKAAKAYPELAAHIQTCMDRQAELETSKTASLDAAAEPSAMMLAYLARMGAADEREEKIRDRFGYCLGRWIYLVDAAEDLPEDLENGSYNPYILVRGLEKGDIQAVKDTREYARFTLNACLAECLAAYNLLHVRRFDGILRNILELGMPAAQKEALTREGPHKKPLKEKEP